ncbi:MAG: glycosyltransferase [Lachnospiraceae bacterium]|nr:glycosyltransferase [Lachnospiraceae bacterium]
MTKIKIMFVNGGLMDRGGISSFICNYLKYFDLEKFEVLIAVHGEGKGQRDEELEIKGYRIINLPIKSKSYTNWKTALRKVLTEENIDIIHANADAGNGPILKIAKKCGIKIRISHSHNTQLLTDSKIRILLNNIQKKQILKYATHLFACSEAAGIWLYGEYPFEVINNAIDYNEFRFDNVKRNEIRERLKIDGNTYVIGHVGRFDFQKNHQFILSVARAMKDQNVIFLLLGDGHLREQIELNISNNKLQNVIILGEVDNVSAYLNAMDCFIMPSLFEGLSVVSIEAQVNGLKCIFSENITKECSISQYTWFLSLTDELEWVKLLGDFINEGLYDRHVVINKFFDLQIQSESMQEKYITYYQCR